MRGEGLGRIGAHPASLWTIKHVVSPIDRLVVRVSNGRLGPLTSLFVPTLLVRTIGRHSGTERMVPLIYIRDEDQFIVGNARPHGRRPNPWVLNLRAARETSIQIRGSRIPVSVDELNVAEVERLWPRLAAIWPALDDFYEATGDRTMFAFRPNRERR